MSLYRVLLLITATVLGVCHCENCSYWSLVQALNLSSQASDERPVQNWLTPTEVTINLKLYAVVELDTSAQTLIAYSWFSMEWKNEFISWNSEEHCAIEGFFAAANNIWKPDIYILEMTETNDKHPVILYYYITQDGTITAAFPLRTVSSCNVDIFMYPYDTQSCTLSFTPYAESGNTVDLSPRYDSKHVLDASNNISSKRGEWNLLNMMVVKEDDKVIYTIILKRNPSIQVMAFIVPTCLLIILDVVGMFIHFEKDDRIMFKITIILGFSLLLVVLNTILPTSDCPPLLSIFCVLCMAIMVASIIGSIMTSYLSNLSDRNTDMPHWMKFCIKTCLAHALFMKRNVYKADGKATSPAAIEHGAGNELHPSSADQKREDFSPTNVQKIMELRLLKMLLLEAKTICHKIISNNTEEEEMSDWHFIALVLDRLLTTLYLLFVIVTFIVIFLIFSLN